MLLIKNLDYYQPLMIKIKWLANKQLIEWMIIKSLIKVENFNLKLILRALVLFQQYLLLLLKNILLLFIKGNSK